MFLYDFRSFSKATSYGIRDGKNEPISPVPAFKKKLVLENVIGMQQFKIKINS